MTNTEIKSTKVIYKYELPFKDDTCIVQIPENSIIRKVAMRKGDLAGPSVLWTNGDKYPLVWIECDKDAPLHSVEFLIYQTGYPIENDLVYLDTVFEDPFVWHIYKRKDI